MNTSGCVQVGPRGMVLVSISGPFSLLLLSCFSRFIIMSSSFPCRVPAFFPGDSSYSQTVPKLWMSGRKMETCEVKGGKVHFTRAGTMVHVEGLLPVSESVDSGPERKLGSPGFCPELSSSELDHAKHLWNYYDILGTNLCPHRCCHWAKYPHYLT